MSKNRLGFFWESFLGFLFFSVLWRMCVYWCFSVSKVTFYLEVPLQTDTFIRLRVMIKGAEKPMFFVLSGLVCCQRGWSHWFDSNSTGMDKISKFNVCKIYYKYIIFHRWVRLLSIITRRGQCLHLMILEVFVPH